MRRSRVSRLRLTRRHMSMRRAPFSTPSGSRAVSATKSWHCYVHEQPTACGLKQWRKRARLPNRCKNGRIRNNRRHSEQTIQRRLPLLLYVPPQRLVFGYQLHVHTRGGGQIILDGFRPYRLSAVLRRIHSSVNLGSES